MSRSILVCGVVLAILLASTGGWADDVAVQGTLSVLVSPSEAFSAQGVGWQVDGGTVQAGSGSIQADEGVHTVSFTAAPPWLAPSDQTVTVLASGTTSVSATFAQLPTYALGQVPPTAIVDGSSAQFYVSSSEGAVSMTTSLPQTATGLSFDTNTGLFKYTPTGLWETFTATFTAGGISQTVSISPLGNLVPEATIFDTVQSLPDPGDPRYVTVTETATDNVSWNNSTRTVYDVVISGKEVVVEKGNTTSTLYDRFNGREDIRSFTIYGETVTIRSRFALPQSGVVIYGRELRFEGADAALVTTASAVTTLPGVLQNGIKALASGDISLHVARFHSDADADGSPVKRLITTGATGQPAGLGKGGASGSSMKTLSKASGDNVTGWPGNVVYNFYVFFPFMSGQPTTAEEGQKAWPGDGKDATPPGYPGAGGDAGSITSSSLDLAPFADMSGGPQGAGAPTAKGGAPGTPNPAHWTSSISSYDWFTLRTNYGIDETHKAKPGKDQPPKLLADGDGAKGTLTVSADAPGDWVHPHVLWPVLDYIRDAYVAGRLDAVRADLAEYVPLLQGYEDSFPSAYADALAQILGEMETLQHRVANNLDYFGNPAGWVPMLSFEANLTAYQNEIQASLPVMWLAYWLENTEANLQAQAAAMTSARTEAQDAMKQLISDYNSAQTAIPGILTQEESISIEIKEVQDEIKKIRDALEQEAIFQVAAKKALHIIAAILPLIPVGQPELGAVGKGLDVIADFDPNNPVIPDSAVDLFKSFNADAYKKNASDFAAAHLKVNPDDPKDTGGKAAMLRKVADGLSKGIEPLIKAVNATATSKSDVEKQLDQLLATNPEYQSLIKRSGELNDEKETLAAKLIELQQTLLQISNSVTATALAIDALNTNIDSSLGAEDPQAMAYVRQMKRRALDRLLQYQYYVAKAYEYRMLAPYTGGLGVGESLVNAFASMLAADKTRSHTLTQDEMTNLAAVYQEQLSDIMGKVFDAMNSNAPERSAEPFQFDLEPEELAELNSTGQVVINLFEKGLFTPTEEDIRILNLTTQSVKSDAPSSTKTITYLDIRYVHSGDSRLTKGGQTYRFSHYRRSDVNPITWRSKYNTVTGQIDETSPSAAQESLLKTLLAAYGGTPSDDLLLYSRPAAWADIVITKTVLPVTVTQQIDIQELVAAVSYSYYDKATNIGTLSVKVDGPETATIQLSKQDMNKRQDGAGNFYRAFYFGDAVTLVAPQTVGDWTFDHWQWRTAQAPSPQTVTSNSLRLSVNNDLFASAVYTNARQAQAPDVPIFAFVNDLTPQDGAISISTASCTVQALAPRYASGLRLNGTEMSVAADSSFWEATVTLPEGATDFSVTAWNDNGESAPVTVTVTYDPNADSDADGVLDVYEQPLGRVDGDGDGLPAWLDADTNGNGVLDGEEPDTDGDGVPDYASPLVGGEAPCALGAIAITSPLAEARIYLAGPGDGMVPMLISADPDCVGATENVAFFVNGEMTDWTDNAAPAVGYIPNLRTLGFGWHTLQVDAQSIAGTYVSSELQWFQVVDASHDNADQDRNGIPDAPFNKLSQEGEIWYSTPGLLKATLYPTFAATRWQGADNLSGDVMLHLVSQSAPFCRVTVTAPKALAEAGEDAVIVVGIAANPTALVGAAEAANVPAFIAGALSANGYYVDIKVLIRGEEGPSWSEVSEERLANHPVVLTMEGAGITASSAAFHQLDTFLGDNGVGPAIGVEGMVWQRRLTHADVEGDRLTVALKQLEMLVPVEGAPALLQCSGAALGGTGALWADLCLLGGAALLLMLARRRVTRLGSAR